MSDITQERRRKFPARWVDGRMIQMFHSLYSWGDFFSNSKGETKFMILNHIDPIIKKAVITDDAQYDVYIV